MKKQTVGLDWVIRIKRWNNEKHHNNYKDALSYITVSQIWDFSIKTRLYKTLENVCILGYDVCAPALFHYILIPIPEFVNWEVLGIFQNTKLTVHNSHTTQELSSLSFHASDWSTTVQTLSLPDQSPGEAILFYHQDTLDNTWSSIHPFILEPFHFKCTH